MRSQQLYYRDPTARNQDRSDKITSYEHEINAKWNTGN